MSFKRWPWPGANYQPWGTVNEHNTYLIAAHEVYQDLYVPMEAEIEKLKEQLEIACHVLQDYYAHGTWIDGDGNSVHNADPIYAQRALAAIEKLETK